MNKAIALRRVSTKDQKINNNSLEQQENSVNSMANELGAVIVNDYAMAISSKKGNNLKRKDLQAALKYCRYNSGIKYLFIDRVSRFMREMKMMFYYIVEFEKLGVKVIFCDPGQRKYNEDTAEAMFELARKATEAETENAERQDTALTKMKRRVELGYYPFHPKQGYKKSNSGHGYFVPDEPRFDLLKKALKFTSSFQMTPKEARQWLAANGYRTPSIRVKINDNLYVTKGNRILDLDHFIGIMKDPFYAGIIRIKGWPENEHGLHKQMILPEEYDINLQIAKGHVVRRKLKNNPDFPYNLALHEPCSKKKTEN